MGNCLGARLRKKKTKIPKNSENKPRDLYFSKALFEGLIFGRAYVRREICVSKSIGLACSGKEIYHFCFVLLCIWGKIPSTSPRGAYVRRGDLMEVFCVTILGGLYLEGLTHGGTYVRNFSFLPLDFTKQENQPSINQIFLFVQWLKNQTLSFYYNHLSFSLPL